MLTEPNCGKAIKEIKAIISSRWFCRLSLAEKQKLLIYLQEIEHRNRCVNWEKLNEIKAFVSTIYKTYNK
jgi:hypothetical protein